MKLRLYALISSLLPALASLPALAGVYEEILQAANTNETAKVVELLRRGMDVNTVDYQGNTLLMIAARNNNVELTRFLLENRANPERRNPYGDTALMLAAMRGHKEIVALMLMHRPELNHSGWTALHYAAFSGHADILALLIAAGANVDLLAPNRFSPLMLAARNGHLAAVRVLVGAKADLSIRTEPEGTALDIARKAGHEDVAAFLERASR